MMRLMNNKKNVKIVSVIIAAIFILGVAGLAYMQMATPAMASSGSSIGVLDTSKVITPDNPDVAKAQQTHDAYAKELQAQFDSQSANMDDQQKQQLYMQLQQQMQTKDQEIQKGMEDKITAAAKAVADGKGLNLVMNKGAVLYGGVDITDLVAKKLTEDATKAAGASGAAAGNADSSSSSSK